MQSNIVRFNSNKFDDIEKYSAWREETASNRAPYEFNVSAENRAHFKAEASVAILNDNILLSKMKASSFELRRTTRHISRNNDSFTFHINRRGKTFIDLDRKGSTHSMIAMQGVLSRNDAPGIVRAIAPSCDESYISYIFEIQRSYFLEHFSDADGFCMRQNTSTNPQFRYLVNFADAIFSEKNSTSALVQDLNHIASLIGSYVSGDNRKILECEKSQRECSLLALIENFIDCNYLRSDIDSNQIAEQLGITQRYLQILMSGTGETFVERVNRLRMELAWKLLFAQGPKRVKIATIAFASGFRNVSYFNRCFFKKYHATPLDVLNMNVASRANH